MSGKKEQNEDSFAVFGTRCLEAVTAYVGRENRVGAMADRIARVISADGAMTKS